MVRWKQRRGVSDAITLDRTVIFWLIQQHQTDIRSADGAWTENGVVQTKGNRYCHKAGENATAAQAQATDDYSGTYIETWSDGKTVPTQYDRV